MRKKTALHIKILKLKTRINELEEIICPTQSHDFKTIKVSHYYNDESYGNSYDPGYDITTRMCTKCKKVERT